MNTVLAPIDFSDITARVVDQAIALARAVGGRLVLLHVVSQPRSAGGRRDDAKPRPEIAPARTGSAARRLAALQRELQARSVTAHAVQLAGRPAVQILEQAGRLEADYVVMGSHGHTALYDLIIGSTAMEVLKGAGCPVVLLPPHDQQRRKAVQRG